MRSKSFALMILTVISFAFLFGGCSGGGGSGGGGGPDPVVANEVAGAVKAPNGQVAFKGKQKVLDYLANFLIPSVSASVSGLLAVPDGTQVDLLRLSDAVTPDETLATTTTEAGNYSFDFDDLGLDYSHDLAVLVSGIGGVQMRAFAVTKSIDIDPVSEAVFRLIYEYINTTPGASLSYFTVEEIKDLIDSIDLLTSLLEMECLNDIEDTVTSIQDAALQDPGVLNFITAAAQPGQTDEGPGDVGNLFPMAEGDTWNYAGTVKEDGGQKEEFTSASIVTGEKQINGTPTIVMTSWNPDNPGAELEEYLVKNSRGLEYWGNNDPGDFISPQIVPYQQIRFPVKVGSKWKNLDDLKLKWREDLDGDGKSESLTLNSTVEALGLKDVSTRLDDFFATMLIENITKYKIELSRNDSSVKVKETLRRWYAAEIGAVKIRYEIVVSVDGDEIKGIQTSELIGYKVNGKGRGISYKFIIADELAIANSDTEMPGAPGIGFDGTNYLVVTYRQTGYPEGIIGILLTPEGRILNEFAIAAYNGQFPNPSVAFDGTNYLVVFSDWGVIRGVRVSAAGNVIDSNGGFQISTETSSWGPEVKFDGAQYLVVWQQYYGSYDIYGSLITPDAQVSSKFPISTAAGDQGSPALDFDGTNYFAVWVDFRNGTAPDYTPDIYGTRISTSGDVVDSEGIAIATAETYQEYPKIAFDGSNYLVVWSDYVPTRSFPAIANIFGKRIRPDGTLMDGNPETNGIEINTIQFGKSYLTLAFDGQNYVVAWVVGAYSNNPPAGIYGARVTPSGILVDGPADSIGLMFSGLPPELSKLVHPTIVSNGTNSLLAWVVNIEVQGATKRLEGSFIY